MECTQNDTVSKQGSWTSKLILSVLKSLSKMPPRDKLGICLLVSLVALGLMEMIPGSPGVSEVLAVSQMLLSHTQQRRFWKRGLFGMPLASPLLGPSLFSQSSMLPPITPIPIQMPL